MRRPVHHFGGEVEEVGAALLAACAAALAPATAAWGNHNTTEIVSTGPNGGNGAVSSQFRGASADGSRIFFQSNEGLVAADTDARMDLYQRAGGTTTLLSTGPNGGNGAFNASFAANSDDGGQVFFRTSSSSSHPTRTPHRTCTSASTGDDPRVDRSQWWQRRLPGDLRRNLPGRIKVFFDTGESLVAGDTDGTWRDVYQRSSGTTTLLSTGSLGGAAVPVRPSPARARTARVLPHRRTARGQRHRRDAGRLRALGEHDVASLDRPRRSGNGNLDFDYDAFFDGASADGSIAWLHTDEVLVAADSDTANDVYERAARQSRCCPRGRAAATPRRARSGWSNATGSRVFLDTTEPLVGADTDASTSIYERSGGSTTLVSTGPNGGNAEKFAAFQASNTDGSRVFFHTAESLLAEDTDTMQDVYERAGWSATLISQGPESAMPRSRPPTKGHRAMGPGLLRHQRASRRGDRDLSRHI